MKTRSVSKTRKAQKVPYKIWEMKLYVMDGTLKSTTAFTNLTKICHDHLEGRCHIAVIDLEKSPQLAKENQIVAVPTLVKTFPLPMRRVIGDLSNSGRVVAGLELPPVIKKDVPITHRLHGRP